MDLCIEKSLEVSNDDFQSGKYNLHLHKYMFTTVLIRVIISRKDNIFY